MPKRTIAGILGSLSVAGGCFVTYTAVQMTSEIAVSGQPVLTWWLLLWFLPVTALIFGVHFLRFALFPTVATDGTLGWRIFVGVSFFFPGFVFSLPLTLVATRYWSLSAPDTFPTIAFVLGIATGVLAAIGCCIFLIRRGSKEGVR